VLAFSPPDSGDPLTLQPFTVPFDRASIVTANSCVAVKGETDPSSTEKTTYSSCNDPVVPNC
jgi:hypothetical protein